MAVKIKDKQGEPVTHPVLFPLPGCRPAADVPREPGRELRNGLPAEMPPWAVPGQDWKDLLVLALPEPGGHGAGRGVAEASEAGVTASRAATDSPALGKGREQR